MIDRADRPTTAFLGAVEGSRRALEALCDAGHVPDLVLTLPAEAAARHSDYADLAEVARKHDVPVFETRDINDTATLAELRDLAPDLILVIGWSQIAKADFRAIPRLGTVGFHPAPLPRLRGRAAIPWTILAGLQETAATLFWIDEGCDSGDILIQGAVPVEARETARSLYDKQIETLCRILPEALDRIAAGDDIRTRQDGAQASYCARRTAEDGRIDWTLTAADVDRLIRAVGEPYPGAFTDHAKGRLWIDSARVHDGPPGYIGMPGQLQEIGDTLIVNCAGFSAIEVTAWRGELPARHTVMGR